MIHLRYATIEDAVALAEVESASFPLAEACSLENFKKRLAVFADCFIVLEEDGRICGLIDGMVTDQQTITDDLYEDASLHNPNGAWQSVFGLAVLPQKRHRGYASLLMMEMMNTPAMVPRGSPTAPVMAVPPTTVAVMAFMA